MSSTTPAETGHGPNTLSIQLVHPFTGPVAHSVERWTPCGGSTRPGYESPGFEARRALDIYEPPDRYGRNQVKSVRGPAVRGYERTLIKCV